MTKQLDKATAIRVARDAYRTLIMRGKVQDHTTIFNYGVLFIDIDLDKGIVMVDQSSTDQRHFIDIAKSWIGA